MIRRTFLRRLFLAAAGVAAGAVRADPVDDITAEIRDQGFRITRVQRTLLGRVRIIGLSDDYRREVVIDPTTGEIRRDLLIPRRGSGGSQGTGAQPQLGTSREIGPIEEDAPPAEEPPAEPAEPDEGDDGADWGGGWGSQDEPAAEPGEGKDGADAP
jgi:hypothetical protein